MREVKLDTAPDAEVYEEKPRNTEMVIVTYVFSSLFLLMAGYLIWFNIWQRDTIRNNAYNTKQEMTQSNVLRGDIVTEDGTLLAGTQVDYSGNEVRTYPYGNVFAHAVGYASNGRSGLEATENGKLSNSHASLMSKLQSSEDTRQKGDTVVVTLDPKLQQAAYNALGSYNGAVVVIEPDSGKILAMVSKPDFDPNAISYNWDYIINDPSNSCLLNRATQGLYPPGSTFKIITTLAYLREHSGVFENYQYDCTGSVYADEVTITCYNGAVHGVEALRNAFANSCNTAYASMGLELDNGRLRKTAESFLFNTSLPVDIPSSISEFRLTKSSSQGDQMTTAIGQGETLATPLHMAVITAAIANGGLLMKPYMVSRVEAQDGSVVSQHKPEIYKQLMSVEEAQILTSFMRETVNSGTGIAMSGNMHPVAAKTGSAEYETNGTIGTHSWFVGFSNAEDPDIVVAVLAEDGGTGSSTALPIAQQIFQAYYHG